MAFEFLCNDFILDIHINYLKSIPQLKCFFTDWSFSIRGTVYYFSFILYKTFIIYIYNSTNKVYKSILGTGSCTDTVANGNITFTETFGKLFLFHLIAFKKVNIGELLIDPMFLPTILSRSIQNSICL